MLDFGTLRTDVKRLILMRCDWRCGSSSHFVARPSFRQKPGVQGVNIREEKFAAS
jgi:hypothetical protein